jgi:hypothetical protein
MRPDWANREERERASDLYGPHTPRESGAAGPWYVPRPAAHLLDKMGRPVWRTAPFVTGKKP